MTAMPMRSGRHRENTPNGLIEPRVDKLRGSNFDGQHDTAASAAIGSNNSTCTHSYYYAH